MEIYYTKRVNQAFHDMHTLCEAFRHEFITPEHFVCALLQQYEFNMALIDCGVDLNTVNTRLKNYLQEQEKVLTRREQFEAMSRQNKSLEKLREAFDLELA